MAVAQTNRTHCPRGHAYTEANTYRSGGRRICRECSLARKRRPKPTLMEKIWSRFRINEAGCWVWTGSMHDAGYGVYGTKLAHRLVYELLVEPIPPGLLLDHECHNLSDCPGGKSCPHRRCVNPMHLKVSTLVENVMSGKGFGAVNARKTHCPRGHQYDEVNTYVGPSGNRLCRSCNRERARWGGDAQ